MERKKVKLLNVYIDNITMEDLLQNFRQGMILTLHVDMIMKLQKDREFYELLPRFDLVTCDSQILYFASKLLGTPLKERVSGSDFFPLYYQHHKDDPSIKIFLCGGQPGVPEAAQSRINAKVGRKMVVGTYSPPFDFDKTPSETEKMVHLINESNATVLVVGLGAGRQEKFLVRHRNSFKHVHTLLPLGGTIDYEANTLPRPSPLVTDLGMEWLYRVVKEPRKRWRRYLIDQPPVIWHLLRQLLGVYRNPF